MKNPQGFTFHLTGDAPEDAVEEKSGRFYVVMGFAGFNTPANNRDGYASRSTALAAVKRHDRGAGRALAVAKPTHVFQDISHITEYGLTQKLSSAIRCF